MVESVIDKIMEVQKAQLEGSALEALKAKLADLENRRKNILKNMEMSSSHSLVERLEELEDEIRDVRLNIIQEEKIQPFITREVVSMWINKFRDGDINDPEFRKTFIETFVARVEVDNEKCIIYYNISDPDHPHRHGGRKGSTAMRQVDKTEWRSNLLILLPYVIIAVVNPVYRRSRKR